MGDGGRAHLGWAALAVALALLTAACSPAPPPTTAPQGAPPSAVDPAVDPADWVGTWNGTIALPFGELEVIFRLDWNAEDRAWSGVAEIPQRKQTLPLAELVITGDDVHAVVTGLGGNPTYAGTRAGDAVDGTFRQYGIPHRLRLERAPPTNP